MKKKVFKSTVALYPLILLSSVAHAETEYSNHISAEFGEARFDDAETNDGASSQYGELRRFAQTGDRIYVKVEQFYEMPQGMRTREAKSERTTGTQWVEYSVTLDADRIDRTSICEDRRFVPDPCSW